MSAPSVDPTSRRGAPSLALLWAGILAPPLAWAVHLSGAYFFVTLHCDESAGNLEVERLVLTLACAVACLLGALASLIAWRHATVMSAGAVRDRARAMAGAGVLLAVLFLLGVVADAVPAALLRTCDVVH